MKYSCLNACIETQSNRLTIIADVSKIELNTWLNHIYCSVHTESDHLSMPIILTHMQSARFPLLTPGLFSAHKSCCYKFWCQLTWRRGADVKHRDFIGTTVTISVKSLYSPGTKLCLGDMKATLEWEHGAGTTGGHSECKWRTYNRHRKQHFFFLFFFKSTCHHHSWRSTCSQRLEFKSNTSCRGLTQS